MKFKGITDVFFDLDHTLWDFDKNSELTFRKIFELHKVNVNISEFLIHYVPINLKYWRLYREDKIEKNMLRFTRLNETFKAINFNAEADLVHKLSDDYMAHLTTFNHLFENTFEILDYLSINYNLHIITNGFDEVQYKKMSHSKIDHYFKTITNSENAGVKKPNPIIFNYALNLAKTKPNKSVMIGDSYEADILGAKNMGMDVVFFDVNSMTVDSDIKQIDNLIQLKKYL
ncbi:MAG: YjjG family noncanonical pyrimidine nucleotidase [Algibacter sp.]|uniref:YjjG family noncanonical pyrimidine nucleotidase n=1 Tax=Algibacter sp. TaxID=1872428 RepID=UPI002629BE51|nr:YjjG family noncanonical pyrimidine nucleotidase [Algibacter sp.]MDG1728763.1 YjjG family noncanonical pyrimidine nucleotidase [Algibacter sp.]MDG2177802.1 YjjG family noncanonical pyrimidine nucleotidase [Algibacter sp.]